MSIFRKFIAPVALVLSMGQAQAQLHEGDVEMSIVSGKIVVDGHSTTQFGTGFKIFEGDFGDISGGPFRTDDPGYDSAPGTFLPGTFITYNTVGSLWFWNGGAWGLAGAERVRLDGNLGEESFFSGTGTSGALTGLVGVAGNSGVIHEHLDMVISRVGGGLPAIGSYMFQLYLTGTNLTASDTFLMVLNRGLSEQSFEQSVQALAVPEPGTWLMWLAGVGLVGAIAARRRH
jgi:hypothetical protein